MLYATESYNLTQLQMGEFTMWKVFYSIIYYNSSKRTFLISATKFTAHYTSANRAILYQKIYRQWNQHEQKWSPENNNSLLSANESDVAIPKYTWAKQATFTVNQDVQYLLPEALHNSKLSRAITGHKYRLFFTSSCLAYRTVCDWTWLCRKCDGNNADRTTHCYSNITLYTQHTHRSRRNRNTSNIHLNDYIASRSKNIFFFKYYYFKSSTQVYCCCVCTYH